MTRISRLYFCLWFISVPVFSDILVCVTLLVVCRIALALRY